MGSTLFLFGDFKNLPPWIRFTITLDVHVYTAHSCLCVHSYKIKKMTLPLCSALARSPLGQTQGGGRNRGSRLATSSAVQLQEPPPSSCGSFPTSPPHYSREKGGLCSSHQLMPMERSRHGVHHGGRLSQPPIHIAGRGHGIAD